MIYPYGVCYHIPRVGISEPRGNNDNRNDQYFGHELRALRRAARTEWRGQDESIGSATIAIDPAVGTLAAAESAIDAAGYDVVKGRVLNVAPTSERSLGSDA